MALRAVFKFIFFIWLPVTVNSEKTNYTIGGLFNIYDPSGNLILSQLEHVSAFILAINEINQNDTLLPNVHLNYIIRHGHGFSDAANSANELAQYGITAAVGALDNEGTSAADLVFNDFGIVMSHSRASATSFGDGSVYKYKVQTCPIDSYQGMVIEGVMCHYGVERVVIFVSEADSDLKATMESGDGTYCSFDNVGTFIFPSYVTDYTDLINKALLTEPTVILLFMPSANAAMILEQGYNLGLLHPGTQVFGNAEVMSVQTLSYFSPSANIKGIMKGAVGVEYWPNFLVTRSRRGKEFLTSWRRQYSTYDNCSHVRDYSNHNYLSFTPGICNGLNFQNYSVNGTEMADDVALTYDATYVIAHGLQSVLESDLTLNGDNLVSSIIGNPPFIGATGFVKTYEGMTSFLYYARGDREVGHHFRVLNFNEDAFDMNINNSFVTTKVWSVEDGVQDCPGDVLCYEPIYNNPENVIVNGYPPFAVTAPPAIVKLGGLFSIFDNNGYLDPVQVENLAAFLMAIRELNNKTDGIADDILVNTQIKFQIDYGNSFLNAVESSAALVNSFFGTGVAAVVGSLNSVNTMASDQLLAQFEIVQSHSLATDTVLGDGMTYPYKVQTSPIDAYEAELLQELMCNYYNIRKIGIFTLDSNFATKSLLEIQNKKYCQFKVLSLSSFPSSIVDFSSILETAKVGGAMVYVFLGMDPATAARLLFQGYETGLFSEGKQIFVGNSVIAGGEIFSRLDSIISTSLYSSSVSMADSMYYRDSLIKSVMKGIISLEYWPKYSLTRTTEGKGFYSRWRNQPYTGPMLYHGERSCNPTLDDSAVIFLYRNQNGSVCAGLNFTTYSDSANEINPFAALTYDATYLLFHGIHELLQRNMTIDGNNLRKVIIENVSFTGATGLIEIFGGMADLSYFGRGGREVGHYYKILNFNADSYSISLNQSFVQILYWNADLGTLECDDDMNCEIPTYNTYSNQPASDTPPPIILTMNPEYSYVLYAFTALVWISVAFLTVVLFNFRNAKLIKASQPIMLVYILIGELLAGGRVLNAALPLNTSSCITGLWLGHLAFTFVFGGLFLKTWRVNRIINNTAFRRISITNYDILRIWLELMACVVAYLLILTFVGRPHQARLTTETSNQSTSYLQCGFKFSAIHTTLFAIEGLVMVYGIKLCYAVKDLPDAVNESKYIALAITAIVMICVLAFPIVYLINLSPPFRQLVASISFAIAALITMAVIFLPKLLILFSNRDMDANFGFRRSSPVSKAVHGKNKVAIEPAVEGKVDSNFADALSSTAICGSVAMKDLSESERLQLCMEQIQGWQTLLLRLSEGDNSSMFSNLLSTANSLINSKAVAKVVSKFQSRANSRRSSLSENGNSSIHNESNPIDFALIDRALAKRASQPNISLVEIREEV